MAKRWTRQENQIFLEILEAYRKEIHEKDVKAATKITKQFAKLLHEENIILQERTQNAIFEHLPYLDDLTAGIGTVNWYAQKDSDYFGSFPRSDGNNEMNLTKRRPYHNRLK